MNKENIKEFSVYAVIVALAVVTYGNLDNINALGVQVALNNVPELKQEVKDINKQVDLNGDNILIMCRHFNLECLD